MPSRSDSTLLEEEAPRFRAVSLLSAPAPLIQLHSLSVAEPFSKQNNHAALIETAIAANNESKSQSQFFPTQKEHVPVGWKQPILTDKSCFHFLEPFHKLLSMQQLPALLDFLPQLFGNLSLAVDYADAPICARMTTCLEPQVALCVSLLRIKADQTNTNEQQQQPHQQQLVLQVQRCCGCSIVFTKYAREIVQQVEAFVDGGSINMLTADSFTHVTFPTLAPPCLTQSVLERCHLLQEPTSTDDAHAVLVETTRMLNCFATRNLALEALVILTDTSKTTRLVAEHVSRALLMIMLDVNDELEEELTSTILRLAVLGRWDDPVTSMEVDDAVCDPRARFQALSALVQAMHVVGGDNFTDATRRVFQAKCLAVTGQDWHVFLLKLLHNAPSHPHEAFLAAKALCQLPPSTSSNSGNAASQPNGVPMAAAMEQAGRCHHAALQAACQQLQLHLES